MASLHLCVQCRRLLGSSYSVLGVLSAAGRGRSVLFSPVRQYSLLPNLSKTISAITEKKKDYSEEKILGYTPQELYSVVADVNNYKLFLPWCKDSKYLRKGPRKSMARLVVGFPPLLESYNALVLHDPPHSMRAIATNGHLFTHLENLWQFRSGPDTDSGPTTVLSFWVRLEFNSLLYARLGSVVFDEVARMMAGAFEVRCRKLYGPDHLKTSQGSALQQRHGTTNGRTRPCESS